MPGGPLSNLSLCYAVLQDLDLRFALMQVPDERTLGFAEGTNMDFGVVRRGS